MNRASLLAPHLLRSLPFTTSASELRKRDESASATGPDPRRTFRFLKQTLGWTTPKLRDPAAADRWTWLIIAAHTQLRLARDLTVDLRRPWERPCPPGRLTPARVRRGFRHLRVKITLPARAPKPGRPGPGRPPGVPNQHRAPRHDVGKTTTRGQAKTVKQPIKG